MKLQKKKGFTVVELVIVLVVIGVLTAILIPTFVNLTNKANEAADKSLVTNLNTALRMEEQEAGHKKANSLQDAIDDLEVQGFILENIVAKSGKDLIWDQKENQFLLNDDSKEGAQYWQIVDSIPATPKYSYYAGKNFNAETVTITKYGFDAGTKRSIKTINFTTDYTTGENEALVVRAQGDQCVLNLNAPNADVNFYGFAKEINVAKVKGSSLHIYGAANKLSVTEGHVAVEDTGIVFDVVAVETTASVTNYGCIANNTSGATISGSAVSDEYEIGSLARLEAFRDAVNSGNSFKGMTVKLTKDIELNNGWRPIGEGSRSVGATNTAARNITTFFRGVFDGNGKTISNLNNKNFVPTQARLVPDKKDDGSYVDTYAYGLFALVGDGAEIRNLTLNNVDIDAGRYEEAIGDSVGALIGYSDGSLKVEDITVNGVVKANDAVGGIIGRSYKKTTFEDPKAEFEYTVDGCVNNANVTAGSEAKQKCAGVIGFINFNGATITDNTNNGTITGGAVVDDHHTLKGSIAVISKNAATNAADLSGNKNGNTAAELSEWTYSSARALGDLPF